MNYSFFIVIFYILPAKAFASGSMFSHSDMSNAVTYMAFLSVIFGLIFFSISKLRNKNTKLTLFQSIAQILGFSIVSFIFSPVVALAGFLLVSIIFTVLGLK